MDKIKEKLHLDRKDYRKEQAGGDQQPSLGPPPPFAADVPAQGLPSQAQYVPPPRPDAHGLQHAGQNVGMMTSVVGGIGGVGGAQAGGMWQDMALGGFVGQQIGQAKNRAYWREQQQRYYSGLPAAGIADPRVAEPMSEREQRRAGRRKARWDRRATRRGIQVPTEPLLGASVGQHGHHGHVQGHSHGQGRGSGHGHHHGSGHDTSGSESDELSD